MASDGEGMMIQEEEEEAKALRQMLDEYEDAASDINARHEHVPVPQSTRGSSRPRDDSQEGYNAKDLGHFLAHAHSRFLVRGRGYTAANANTERLFVENASCKERYVVQTPAESTDHDISPLTATGHAVYIKTHRLDDTQLDSSPGCELPIEHGSIEETIALHSDEACANDDMQFHLQFNEPPIEPSALQRYEEAHRIFDRQWARVVNALSQPPASVG